MKKDNTKKNKDKTSSVWDNYKCDGQYKMEFTDDTILIVEEPKDLKTKYL